ncbi:MAG: alkaline phosphatase family protein [Gemmatimonadetes bacterium]|nr:alkaline phosphatase family protein [Gemmatimonadota bacterium]
MSLRYLLTLLAALVPFGFLGACSSPAGDEAEQDGVLLVYVVVDRLRADLLDRYESAFTGGFVRLRAAGHRWENATVDHAHTATAAGHATAAMGTHPHRHGVVGNDWLEQGEDGSWESVYALRDRGARIVGESGMEGRGPANLVRTGLPDWIEAHDSKARIVSISGKDRAAVAMAGRSRGEVYWMSSSRGRFLTSTYYRNNYPRWVERFHRRRLANSWSDTVWHSTIPHGVESLSRPDTFAFEGDGVNTYFPHRASREADGTDARSLNRWRNRGPYPDQAALDLAREAVRELKLGRRGAIDYLALALSQVDRVGHSYGPFSREQLDNLLRLDRELGSFMEFLDENVGAGRWMLALTADHGVMELPEARRGLGLFGRRVLQQELDAVIARAEATAEAAGTDPLAQARAAAATAREADWVADAFVWDDLIREGPADSLQALYLRSWHPERRLPPVGHLGIGVRLLEGAYAGNERGTGHESPYIYDRHVPFMIMARGLEAGTTTERVSLVDLAPTLAQLLGVPYPDDLDGRSVVRR